MRQGKATFIAQQQQQQPAIANLQQQLQQIVATSWLHDRMLRVYKFEMRENLTYVHQMVNENELAK